ncbi:ribonuclease HII [Lapillicoccus sp.]|uniref:ribonuclease HII n=1 Tax=Lapillicoccus sp. TaxID=1909287 RepID=UPI0025F4E872|nr:ribonuclease HII [Lapillicoccus sp.]
MTGVRSRKPSLRVERALQRGGHRVLAGMDEVGRGALAGPVSVGVVVIDETCRSAPTGVKDSKLLTPSARQRMIRPIQRWANAYAVGHASPTEIDEFGIMGGLRMAGTRALAAIAAAGIVPDLVILDGNHDWLTPPGEVGLFAFAEESARTGVSTPPVTTMIKADLRCSSVAAASVLAKVERDAMMVGMSGDHPAYCWAVNKGYAAPEHLEALRVHGPSVHHRLSWRLPSAQVVEQGDSLPGMAPQGPVRLAVGAPGGPDAMQEVVGANRGPTGADKTDWTDDAMDLSNR